VPVITCGRIQGKSWSGRILASFLRKSSKRLVAPPRNCTRTREMGENRGICTGFYGLGTKSKGLRLQNEGLRLQNEGLRSGSEQLLLQSDGLRSESARLRLRNDCAGSGSGGPGLRKECVTLEAVTVVAGSDGARLDDERVCPQITQITPMENGGLGIIEWARFRRSAVVLIPICVICVICG
jgi:hypothetical protein